jgi:mono/diheme cytochrome c family protein
MKTFALALALTACSSSKTAAPTAPSPVERGKYLVSVGGCNDCHTPMKMTPTGPAPDMDRLLSGHPAQFALPPAPPPSGPWMVAIAATGTSYAGPWGTSFTANLTPDKATGIGAWTADNFISTIRNGKHMGAGRDLLPPMPWQNYAQMTDEDLRAMFAYLGTIPAISNKVPEPLAPATAMLEGAK